MKRFYSVEEAAAELDVSPQTVRNRIREGKLYAAQGTERGPFKIHAQSLIVYKEKIGLLPPHKLEMPALPEPEVFGSAVELYEARIAPTLAEAGVDSVAELLARAEQDQSLLPKVRGVLPLYQAFLAEAADLDAAHSKQPATAGA